MFSSLYLPLSSSFFRRHWLTKSFTNPFLQLRVYLRNRCQRFFFTSLLELPSAAFLLVLARATIHIEKEVLPTSGHFDTTSITILSFSVGGTGSSGNACTNTSDSGSSIAANFAWLMETSSNRVPSTASWMSSNEV